MDEKTEVKSNESTVFKGLKSLAPNEDIDISGYSEAIDFALSDSAIRNVALSGAYGSGKSSVMKSYEKKHSDKRYLHISLAHFEEQESTKYTESNKKKLKESNKKKSEESNKSKSVKLNVTKSVKSNEKKDLSDQGFINVLEGKIFNQLLHQVDAKKIPKALFRAKENDIPCKKMFTLIGLFLSAVLCFGLANFEKWVDMVCKMRSSNLKMILKITTTPTAHVVGYILLAPIIAVVMYNLMCNPSVLHLFRKVDLKGIFGFEMSDNTNDSLFDRFLNDVIYLFDNSGADIIVFEDLDRYELTKIFSELREINDLVYLRRKRRNEEKVLRFFYLIRDDVFTSSDRSKFFDLIIPVIPVVDTTNSYDKFIALFKEAGIGNQFSQELLQGISLYLGDMRLVTNIINEYIIYSGKLVPKDTDDRPNSRLAMLIYKNLYPHDYSLLLQGKGYVFALFQKKKELSDNLLEELDSQLSKAQERLKTIDREYFESLDELNAVFFPLNEKVVTISGKSISSNISRVELIKSILENPDSVESQASRYSNALVNVADLRRQMELNPVYQQRKETIELQRGIGRENLERDILQARLEKYQVQAMSLKGLISKIGVGSEIINSLWEPEVPPYEKEGYFNEIRTSRGYGLLQYLIREGYINENYASDVSIFYSSSLKPGDHRFLLSLSERKPLGPEYRIQDPATVLSRLSESQFAFQECWNYNLVDYLFDMNDTKLLRKWFGILGDINGNAGSFEFLISYWQFTKKKREFVEFISENFPEWFYLWTVEKKMAGTFWYRYCSMVISFVLPDRLNKMNQDDWLTKKISADSRFLTWYSGDNTALIDGLKALNVKFQNIGNPRDIPELVAAVYLNNLYELNYKMIELFMSLHWGVGPEEIKYANYTSLSQRKDEPLFRRVQSSMDEYMQALLEDDSVRFRDKEERVLELLNSSQISPQHKENYIAHLDTKISSLENVNDKNLWIHLLIGKALKCTWENVVDYFAGLESGTAAAQFPDELVSFVEGNEKLSWTFEKIKARIGEKADDFLNALVSSISIPIERYSAMLKTMVFKYDNFPIKGLPKDRMGILIDTGLIKMTVENLRLIRNDYPELFVDYAMRNIGAYIDLAKDGRIVISESELPALLKNSRLSDKNAIFLLDVCSGTISVREKNYSTNILLHIIATKLDTNDISWFLTNFSAFSPPVKKAFTEYAIKNESTVRRIAMSIKHVPAEIYAAWLGSISTDTAEALRPYLPTKDFDWACRGGNPIFEDTESNRAILEFFKRCRWISSFSVQKDGRIRAYAKRN